MAKSKGKGQKQNNVFHVANSKSLKAKNKAKPVTSSLKKIGISNNDKVSKVNKAFTELQKDVTQLKKTAASNPKQTSRPAPEATADVDNTTHLLSQL